MFKKLEKNLKNICVIKFKTINLYLIIIGIVSISISLPYRFKSSMKNKKP